MGVDVEDGLTGRLAGVEHQPEVAVGVLRGDRVGEADELGEKLGVARGEFHDVAVLLGLGDHEQVHGRLGCDVADGERVLGLRDDLGGDLAVQDAREDRRLAHGSSLSTGPSARGPAVTSARARAADHGEGRRTRPSRCAAPCRRAARAARPPTRAASSSPAAMPPSGPTISTMSRSAPSGPIDSRSPRRRLEHQHVRRAGARGQLRRRRHGRDIRDPRADAPASRPRARCRPTGRGPSRPSRHPIARRCATPATARSRPPRARRRPARRARRGRPWRAPARARAAGRAGTSSRAVIRTTTSRGATDSHAPVSQAPAPSPTVISSPTRTRRTAAAWCASAPVSATRVAGAERPTPLEQEVEGHRRSAPEAVAQLGEQALLELGEVRRRRLRLLGEVLDERALPRVEARRGDDVHAHAQVAAVGAAQRRDAASLDRQDVAALDAGADLEFDRPVERRRSSSWCRGSRRASRPRASPAGRRRRG